MNNKSKIAYIALGSNLGNRQKLIADSLKLLAQTPGIEVTRVSTLIKTTPIGGPADQGEFLNAVAKLSCELTAEQLLANLHKIEHQLGRHRLEKWGPRTIDLDLLLFADQIIDKPNLKVPHPLMTQRTFVMIPLAEIAADVRHPATNKTMKQILQELEH